MRIQFISICFLTGVIASLTACRTSNMSTEKDIAGSPADVSKSSYVVFLTPADSKVHKGECPAINGSVNRSCNGLKDLSQIAKSDYETGLRKAILALRPNGAPVTQANPALVKTLEAKIARINTKLASDDLSAAEKTGLQSQLANLNSQLIAAKAPTLTPDEQKRFDFIMLKLVSNADVTLDEGEVNYQLATAPFGGSAFGMTFMKIPAGKFNMGSPDEEAGHQSDEVRHEVTFAKEFELQTTEVTQGQWVAVMDSNPSAFKSSENCSGEFVIVNNVPMCPNNPVEQVSWEDVQAFIQKLNANAGGYKYRLPTEAEWEYAARAGTTGAYAGDLDAMAWYDKNSANMTHPVAKKQPNAWGLYDMHGNVWEWTGDWYGAYSAAAVTDPQGASTGTTRVNRGGSWNFSAQNCRSSIRSYNPPSGRNSIWGFRLLRTGP